MSHISSTNSGIKLGLRIIVNKIEKLKKKKAAFKLIRHLKLAQFVLKLNYIVKVKSFLNLEYALFTMRQRLRLMILEESTHVIFSFCLKQQRTLKAKGFLRLKMIRNTEKASLIPFAIILKKIIR